MLGKNRACIADGITISKIYTPLIDCIWVIGMCGNCEMYVVMCLQNVNSAGYVIDL
jgi:hypothetical protein